MQDEHTQLAAIDLGSNSFHMVVATQAQNEIRVQEGLSEKVQLGAGLDDQQRLTEEAQQRALDCLGRFAQRIRGIPVGSVRVVGTNTLRVARNARQFIARAEQVLGHDIEVVAGREEARLIYLGVSHTLPDNGGDRRLVVDIGGGSTELIIGERFESVETESLHMGCVSFSQRFFAEGQIAEKPFARAVTAARQEVLSIESAYRRLGWQQAVGASGTIKAIAQVCEENGWSDGGVTLDGLHKIRKRLLRSGHVARLDLKGLREDRAAIFPAGVAILTGIFEQLGIDRMEFSSGALREGVLYDLIGRFSHEDVRERSIQAMMKRHHVDAAQAARVQDTALMLHGQVSRDWSLGGDTLVDTLRWAALLHEVGFTVSHAQYHKHGAYLVSNSDLSGFSKQEQELVALLVRSHRRKIPLPAFEERVVEERVPLLRLALLLRLAALLHHGRYDTPLPQIIASVGDTTLSLRFPPGWLVEHPLTQADLELEQEFFRAAGYDLGVQ
ncbi:MAG: exopolyphosphatase [Alcanivoracaceae bacterium]